MTPSDSAGSEGHAAVIERAFNAPRELVWQAWTDAAHFKRWYGPQSMTCHTCEIDFRVGGHHLFGMRSADGWEYWTAGVYQEIVAPERFVATDTQSDKDGNIAADAQQTLVTVVLEDLGDGKTRLTVTQSGWADPAMAEGAGGGWNQAFDKLVEMLAVAS